MSGVNKGPELSDLLIVRRHEDRNGMVKQVAVLVQAKMSVTGEIKLPNGDPQLYLYTHWPRFKLKAKNAPNTRFAIGQNPQQALYSGIRTVSPQPTDNDAWAGFCPWGMMSPRQQGWVMEPLSAYLIKLLNFEAGREFYDDDKVGCHWSELIRYLLKTTFALPLRTRDISLNDPRGSTNRVGFVTAETHLGSKVVPAARFQELHPGGIESFPEESQEQFAEEGEGRVLVIETFEN